MTKVEALKWLEEHMEFGAESSENENWAECWVEPEPGKQWWVTGENEQSEEPTLAELAEKGLEALVTEGGAGLPRKTWKSEDKIPSIYLVPEAADLFTEALGKAEAKWEELG